MFSRVRIAIRFFIVGLAVGVLLAPRSGEETRRMVREKADRLLNDVLDAATMGTYESGAGATETATGSEDDEPAPKSTRAGNGSRTRAKSTAATEAGI
jgi:gas vesicle protein